MDVGQEQVSHLFFCLQGCLLFAKLLKMADICLAVCMEMINFALGKREKNPTDMKKEDTFLDNYFAGLGDAKPLSAKEEETLSAQIRQGDQKALGRLVEANLRYVVTIAKQYRGRGLGLDDLVAEGNTGLLKAARRFDAGRGTRFAPYAAPFIRSAIQKALDAQGLFTVPAAERTPSSGRRSKALSVDAPVGGSAELSLLHVLPDVHSPQADERVERGILSGDLQAALSVLNERELKVVELFYGIGHDRLTFAEIAEEMGLKRERVRQIRDRAVRRMCHEGHLGANMKSYLSK